MSVDQPAQWNVVRRTSQVARSVRGTAHGTPTPVTPVTPGVEHVSVLDDVTPTPMFGWRITSSHALRC